MGHPVNAEETKTLWEAVRLGKAFAMMRHALAPGTGDPENFKLNDCRTQRNLSDQGRKQAETIGERFRKNGIEHAAVFSSAWCRCQDTAEGLKIGPVKTLASLNSFFETPERRGPQGGAGAARTPRIGGRLTVTVIPWPPSRPYGVAGSAMRAMAGILCSARQTREPSPPHRSAPCRR